MPALSLHLAELQRGYKQASGDFSPPNLTFHMNNSQRGCKVLLTVQKAGYFEKLKTKANFTIWQGGETLTREREIKYIITFN